MKKIILSVLFISIFCANLFAAQSNNNTNNVYSVYSENFNGVKMNINAWKGQSDRQETLSATADSADWIGWSANGIAVAPAPVDTLYAANAPLLRDGDNYWRLTVNKAVFGSWGGGGVGFVVPGTFTLSPQNMGAYGSGTLEFYIRFTAGSDAGNLRVGYNATATGDVMYYLSALNYTSADGTSALTFAGLQPDTWYKTSIQLTSAANLGSTNYLWLIDTQYMSAAVVSTIDFDQIVWRKAGNPISFDAKLMDITTANLSTAGQITWNNPDSWIGKGWRRADQYLELNLDGIPGNNWGIQIYTDCTSANPNANPKYTGPVDANTAFGLVSADGKLMAPMAWRITDKVLPYTYTGTPPADNPYPNQTFQIAEFPGDTTMGKGLYDAGTGDPNAKYSHTWFRIKDKSQFLVSPVDMNTDIYNGADYVRVWDRKGFHSAAGSENYWGMSPGAMINMRIAPKLYFAIDTNRAYTPNNYKNNSITLQLFAE